MYNPRIFDSDAYGVNTDSPLGVADWFNPSIEACKQAQELFTEAVNETLMELAEINGIDYEVYREWNSYDWQEFREALDI